MKNRSSDYKSHPYERATRRFYETTPYDTFLLSHDIGFDEHVGIQVLRSLPSDQRSTVVDVGCGTGWLLRKFWNRNSMRAVGIDLSLAALTSCRAEGDPHLVLGSNARIPVASNSANAVLSCGVVHHTANPRESFDELVRILKPGGLLALQIYNRDDVYYWIFQVIGGPLRFVARRFPPIMHVYRFSLLPVFFLAVGIRAFLRSGSFHSKSYRQAWNHFRDFLLTPRAEFYRRAEVTQWLDATEMVCVRWEYAFGEHCIIARKRVGEK